MKMKHFQLTSAGLLTLFGVGVTAVPGKIRSLDKPVQYLNNASTQYHCNSESNVIRCGVNDCLTVENCAYGCTGDSEGVRCIIPHVFEAMTSPVREERIIAARDENVEGDVSGLKDKKTKKCSNDHRGVMTCYEGFCTVERGDYCPLNKSCHDDCACCRKP